MTGIKLLPVYAVANIRCTHSDDSDKVVTMAVAVDEDFYTYCAKFGNLYYDKATMVYDIRNEIEKSVNPNGYYHEVSIDLDFMYNGKILDTVAI